MVARVSVFVTLATAWGSLSQVVLRPYTMNASYLLHGYQLSTIGSLLEAPKVNDIAYSEY